MLIEPEHPDLSIVEQCEILGIARSSYYYQAIPESAENLAIMHRLDELHTKYPFYGSRQLTAALLREDLLINRKRTQRLMHVMGLEAVYCRPKTTISNPQHRVFPYLLRSVPIIRTNHVWSIDITYIRMKHGFLYLAAIIDWFSRYVLSCELSNTLNNGFCIEILKKALQLYGNPEIFNSDQGSQFTADTFTHQLLTREIKISMDGKGRAIDNVFIERLWRSVKYEEVYLKDYITGADAHSGLKKYFNFYNEIRTHSALAYSTPSEIFFA